ncbi:MAG: Hsp20/alpha crystallin family protein [bacterium]
MAFKNLIPWQRANSGIQDFQHSPFYSLRDEMNKMFEDFFKDFDLNLPQSYSSAKFNPSVNVAEDKDKIEITAELPGMDEKDVELTLSENKLTISGEKKEEVKKEKENYHYLERKSGYFRRTIQLPVEINTEQAEAEFNKGVLKVILPKSKQAEKIKKIQIKSE